MSLNLYKNAEGETLLTDDPPVTTHNGFTGEYDYFSFFIKSDDGGSYSNVTVDSVLKSAVTNVFNYKLHLGSERLSAQEWDEIDGNNAYPIGTINNSNAYEVQCRLWCNAGQSSAEAYLNGELSIELSYQE